MSLMLLTRIGWAGRYWALPFLTALVVSARYDRRKGRRHKTFTDYAAGGCRTGTWWWWPMAATPSASSCGIARTCQSRLSSSPNCARTRPCTSPRHAAARPDRAAPGGRRATAQSHGGAGRSRYTMDSLPRHRFRRQYRHGRAASGVALWYHGGPPRLPIRWVVIRYLAERRGPYALLCTDTAAEPLRIRGICCGGRSR